MAMTCEHCPLRRKGAFHEMSQDEIRFMARYKVGELIVDPGTTILMQGSSAPQLYTALDGMGLRYRRVDGRRRQVINFLLPGDFIGLQAAVMGEMGHSVEATTRMTLCVFDRMELWSLFRTQPDRAYDVTWLAAAEERFLGDALAVVGQQTALESVAWALTRLYMRGQSLGLVEERDHGGTMHMPYRQQDLADTMGLSLVHTNKTLAKLRERGLVSWSDRSLRVLDFDALSAVGGLGRKVAPQRPLM